MRKKHGPWTILSSKKMYKNQWIEILQDEVIRPDNKRGIFGVIKQRGGVSVLPIDDKGFVYLTEEFHYAIGRNSLETVSGGIEGKETPLAAAKRELKEELGIVANEWLDRGLVDPLTTVLSSPQRLFLAKGLKFYKSDQEGTETITIVKIPLSEAIAKVLKSEITHGPSCVLILKAKEYFNI